MIPAAHEYDDGACIHCGEPYIVELTADSYNVYEPEFSGWDVDKAYYSYTPKYTESYTFRSVTGGDTIGSLYDSDGNLLAENDDDGDGNTDFTITYPLEAGKTYYLVSEQYMAEMKTGFALQLRVNHDYESVTVPATCTVDGRITSTCKICGFQDTEKIYAEHSWNDGVVTEEYSCETQGSITYTCLVCADTTTEPMGGYGHSYYEGIYCRDCGKIMEEEGSCGDDLTWKVDSTQTVTISGTGEMYDYENESPWADYNPAILKVVIGEGVTSVGAYAFDGCYKLTTVILPATLKHIGAGAIRSGEIEELYIPAAVDSIGPNALSATTLRIDESNLNYSTDGAGALLNREKTVLYANTRNLTGAYRIPDGIETIAADALKGNISCLIIPSSVKTIEDRAVANGMGYDGIIRFEGDAPAFSSNAFAGDREWNSFDGKVYYPGDNTTWAEDILLDYGGTPQWNPVSEVMDSGICGDTLEWTLDAEGTLTITGTGPMTNFGYIWLPDGTENYIECPWEEYRKLIVKVVLSEGITRIGDQAFQSCAALRSIEIPDSVTYIGDNAFEECRSLTEIQLPDSVTALGSYMFMDCEALTRVRLPNGIKMIPDTMFGRCRALVEVNIPDSVTRIESAAFSNCNSLEKIVLPEGVTFIGYWAFQHCNALKEINIPSALKVLDSKAFRDCPSLTTIELPEGLITIADSVFYGCTGLTELKIPGTVKKIGWGAFAGCSGLTEMTIPEGVSYLGGTFWGCTGLSGVTIPDSVTNLAYWAFRDCTSLKELKLPEQLQYIGDGIFTDSTVGSITFPGNAPEFAIPGSVTDDAYGTFQSSAVLAELSAPETLQPVSEGDDSSWAVTYPRYGTHVGTFGGVSATAYYPGNNITWTDAVLSGNYGGNVTWLPIGAVKNRVVVEAAALNGHTSIWIDGKEYDLQTDGDNCYVDLPDSNAKTMIAYTYHVDDTSDVHTQYPVSMKVWTLSNEDGLYTATRTEELDDILQYSGSSIRVTGKQGIRMITSIEKSKKKALISDGLAGYTLKEYGTVVAWTRQMGTNPLVLGKAYAKSNYAYKKDVADPVFAYDSDRMQYTNVLVGFSNAQCKNDLAMRPYMILEDAEGNEITLYGGIVTRSIGYIAYQNRNYFEAGTEAYGYVWDIIHSVYGDAYDAEYQE